MLKQFIPNSLFGRFLLIITVPTIIAQIVAIYVFYYSHIDNISKYMARGVLGEMRFIKESFQNKSEQKLVSDFANSVDIKFSFHENQKLEQIAKISDKNYRPTKILGFLNPLPILDPLNRLKIELKNSGLTPFGIHKGGRKRLDIKIQLTNGVLSFNIPKKRVTSSSVTIFVLWMLFTAILMSAIAIIFLKNQIRSIKDLSKSAEKFGRGEGVKNFKPSGAKEIKSAGISFIKMKERINRQITQRTSMLSAVSHDLRTPLTRMKLQLEMLDNKGVVEELKLDIADMEKMINEYLDFVKGGQKEKPQNIKIKNFLEDVIAYYFKANKNIKYDLNLENNLEVNIKCDAFKRVMRNLIDNAFSFGKNIEIKARNIDNELEIVVDDDGPGILREERENIFKPFYRIDNSRNLDKTGAGLGLSIVMDVVTSHGGKVTANSSPLGGLRIIIQLPI